MTEIVPLHKHPYLVHATERQLEFAFPNGYGASIINDGFGRDADLFELAVMHEGQIDYTTPITSDVLGYQSREEVMSILDRIAALPGREIKA